jgi:hypothetical protein
MVVESCRFHLQELSVLCAFFKTWSDSKICLYT